MGSIPMQLVINIANIIVLFLILQLLVYKPVKKFMDKRSEKIQKELQEAQQKHDAAEQEQKNMTQTLSQMEQTTVAALKEKQTVALNQADIIILNAKKEAEAILNTAREQAAQEHRKALMNLKDEVAKLAVDIAEKLIARELQQKDNETIVDEFFKEVK